MLVLQLIIESNCRSEPVFDGNKGHLPVMENVCTCTRHMHHRALCIKPCINIGGVNSSRDATAKLWLALLLPLFLLRCCCAIGRAGRELLCGVSSTILVSAGPYWFAGKRRNCSLPKEFKCLRFHQFHIVGMLRVTNVMVVTGVYHINTGGINALHTGFGHHLVVASVLDTCTDMPERMMPPAL